MAYDIFYNDLTQTLNYFYRGLDNITYTASICTWNGVGEVTAEINPTTLQTYIDGVACPVVNTEDISTANFIFDEIFVGGRGPAQDASLIGYYWDFDMDGRLMRINEGTGIDIKDSTGVSFGALIDAIPSNFWQYLINEDQTPNNLYSIKDTVPVIVPVAEMDSGKGVANWGAGDFILLDEVPPCIFTADCMISSMYDLDLIDFHTLFIATSSTESAVRFRLEVQSDNDIKVETRDKDSNAATATWLGWDGKGKLSIKINGTQVTVYIDDVQFGSVGAILDMSDFVQFPFDTFTISQPEIFNARGAQWGFQVGPLKIPLNETTGTDIHDENGVKVGVLTNASGNFHDNGRVYLINQNPTSNDDLNTLGFYNDQFLTRAYLDTLTDFLIAFTTSWIYSLYRALIYNTGTTLIEPKEVEKAMKYVKRTESYWKDENGAYLKDGNGDYAIANDE
jgi:hypothetical protein